MSNHQSLINWLNKCPIDNYESNSEVFDEKFYRIEYIFSGITEECDQEEFLVWLKSSPFEIYKDFEKQVPVSDLILINEIEEIDEIGCILFIPNDGSYPDED